MRKLISGVAAEAGWQVAGEASNGEQAVELYQQLKPDLVTMDLVMPAWAAWRLSAGSASSIPDAQVIMVTALDQNRPPGLDP